MEYEDVVSEAGILNNDIRSKKVVKAGIVFYDTQVLYGKLRPYLHNWLCPDFSGVAVGDWWVLKPCYVVREFIYRIIQTKRFDNATNQSSGSKMPRADWNLVSNTEFMIPSDSSEQEKIGLYFKKIDHLITLHQSKSFGHILKAIVSCTLSWEQRKLSDLYEKVIEKNDLSFGTDKIISVASMYYKEDTSNSDDDYMRTYNVMRLGDIAFEGNKSKNFAHGRFVENTIGDGIVSHVFDVFRPISEYDLLFWKYFINYEGVMGRIMIRCTKSSTMMTNLVAKDFLEESIVVPSIVEQKRIGYYLKSIDHLITLHQLEPFQMIFKAIAYRIIDYAKSKPPRYIKYEDII